MRVIVAGSRTITDMIAVEEAMELSGFEVTSVVSGTASGVDKLGERWAKNHGVPISQYPANWNLYGKSAGYKRNVEMALNADSLVAVWDGVSKGTRHMIDIAKSKNLRIYVHNTKHTGG
jgi:YspA, cpYpsA-related SLOG family